MQKMLLMKYAMCYKLTSLYGLAHGHAAALCVSKLWPYMMKHKDKCTDPRGSEFLDQIFDEIAGAFGCENGEQAVAQFTSIIKRFNLQIPEASEEEYIILKKSVNPVRLKNNPVGLDENAIEQLYHEILKGE